MIIAIGGRPRTGKSKLAKHLAVALDGVLLDLAQLRNVLFPTALTASREQAARLYEWLLQAAVWNLHQRPAAPVVLDAHPLTHARDVCAQPPEPVATHSRTPLTGSWIRRSWWIHVSPWPTASRSFFTNSPLPLEPSAPRTHRPFQLP